MKKILFSCFVFLFISDVFAQKSGYKDFTWDISIAEVKSTYESHSAYANWKEYDDYPNSSFSFLMYNMFKDKIKETIPNLLSATENYIRLLNIGSDDWYYDKTLFFHFNDNKLFAVTIFFITSSILPELKKRYGESNQVTLISDYGEREGCVWQDESGRFIVWEKIKKTSYTQEQERVTYVNPEFIKNIAPIAFQIHEKEQVEINSKLDY